MGNRTLAYDGLSRLTSVTDAKDQRTTLASDALDRLTERAYVDRNSITYTYASRGVLIRRCTVCRGSTDDEARRKGAAG